MSKDHDEKTATAVTTSKDIQIENRAQVEVVASPTTQKTSLQQLEDEQKMKIQLDKIKQEEGKAIISCRF